MWLSHYGPLYVSLFVSPSVPFESVIQNLRVVESSLWYTQLLRGTAVSLVIVRLRCQSSSGVP